MKECNKVSGGELWHQRPRHASHQRICDAVTNDKVRGVHLKSDEMKKGRQSCGPCVEGKMSRKAFPKAIGSKTSDVLDLVYSDVCGPMSTESLGGARYFFSLTDDY